MIGKEEIKELQDEYRNLKTLRDTKKAGIWEKVVRYCLPTLTDVEKKQRWSTTAEHYTSLSANALQGWAYGRSISWLRMDFERSDIEKNDEIKKWLQTCEDIILKDLSRSAFYDEALSFTKIEFNLSNAILVIDYDEGESTLIFDNINPLSAVIDEDKFKRSDILIYEFELSKTAAENAYGDKIPNKIKNCKEPYQYFTFYKAIFSSKRHDYSVSGNGEWIEVIWAEDSLECVSERRMSFKPFVFWPFSRTASSPYGVGSPGESKMADIEGLNIMEKAKLNGIQLREQPPVKATEGLSVNIVPSGITYLSQNQDFQYAPPPGNSVEISNEIALKEQHLREAYYVDYFLLLQQTIEQKRTATEASLLSDEKSQIMASFTSSLTYYFLEPVLEAVFAIELEHGAFPTPPKAIQGEEIKIDYISPLAVAQKKAQKYAPAREFVSQVLAFSEINSEILNKIKLDKFIDKAADLLNVDRDIIASEKEYKQLVEQQRQRALEQLESQNRLNDAKAESTLYGAYAKKPESGSPAEAMIAGRGQNT